MRLNDFQTRFKDLMLDHPDALLSPPEDLAAFCKKDGIALPERLKVYRNNIVGNLGDMMLATFPALEKLVGKDFLEHMARSFILTNPPGTGCMNLYGEGFAEFIETFKPAQNLPYLPDMARLELALNRAYYAPDDTPLSAQALAAVPPESLADLPLRLRQSVCLLSSEYPLEALYDFCFAQDQSTPPDMGQGRDGERLMIYRPHHKSLMVKTENAEQDMLAQLQAQKPLGEAVEAVLTRHPDFDIQAFLQKHLALETFAAMEGSG